MATSLSWPRASHGYEPPMATSLPWPRASHGEFTTTECGVNYQLLAVITEVAQ